MQDSNLQPSVYKADVLTIGTNETCFFIPCIGIEPMTSSLQDWRTTTMLTGIVFLIFTGSGIRTHEALRTRA